MTIGILINIDGSIEERDFAGLRELQAAVQGNIQSVDLYDIDGSTLWTNEEGMSSSDPSRDINDVATSLARKWAPDTMLGPGLLGPCVLQGPLNDWGDNLEPSDAGRKAIADAQTVVAVIDALEDNTTPPAPLLDGDGIEVKPGVEIDDVTRRYFAGKVHAPECPHYMAKSERDAGFTKCERCT